MESESKPTKRYIAIVLLSLIHIYMHMELASNVDEALAMAFKIKGNDAKVAVIPDGLGVVVNI